MEPLFSSSSLLHDWLDGVPGRGESRKQELCILKDLTSGACRIALVGSIKFKARHRKLS